MKAFLMHRDRDFDLKAAAPANEAALRKDLELDTLFVAMANGDPLILDVVSKAVLTGAANDLATILRPSGDSMASQKRLSSGRRRCGAGSAIIHRARSTAPSR
jgi:hypothetical protein